MENIEDNFFENLHVVLKTESLTRGEILNKYGHVLTEKQKAALVEAGFVPNINYSRTTHNNMDTYISVNGKVKTKFFGK